MTCPTLNRPISPADKCKFVSQWADWFYNTTNSYTQGLARSLAYLWPAIVKDNQIEVAPQTAIVQHLRQHDIPEHNAIWTYLDVI
jgi:hypothetical protein